MCDSGEFELNYNLKCQVCGKKPAVDLSDEYTDKKTDTWRLCEKCGIEIYGEDIVAEWAGTELYLQKYPDQVEVWR